MTGTFWMACLGMGEAYTFWQMQISYILNLVWVSKSWQYTKSNKKLETKRIKKCKNKSKSAKFYLICSVSIFCEYIIFHDGILNTQMWCFSLGTTKLSKHNEQIILERNQTKCFPNEMQENLTSSREPDKIILFLIFYVPVTKKINFGSHFSLLALSTVRFCVIFINSQWSLNDECYQQIALSHLSKNKNKQFKSMSSKGT